MRRMAFSTMPGASLCIALFALFFACLTVLHSAMWRSFSAEWETLELMHETRVLLVFIKTSACIGNVRFTYSPFSCLDFMTKQRIHVSCISYKVLSHCGMWAASLDQRSSGIFSWQSEIGSGECCHVLDVSEDAHNDHEYVCYLCYPTHCACSCFPVRARGVLPVKLPSYVRYAMKLETGRPLYRIDGEDSVPAVYGAPLVCGKPWALAG